MIISITGKYLVLILELGHQTEKSSNGCSNSSVCLFKAILQQTVYHERLFTTNV